MQPLELRDWGSGHSLLPVEIPPAKGSRADGCMLRVLKNKVLLPTRAYGCVSGLRPGLLEI